MHDTFSADLVHEFRAHYLSFTQTDPTQAFNFFVRGLPLLRRNLPNSLMATLDELGIASPHGEEPDSVVSEIRLFPFYELLIATDHLWYAEPSAKEGMVMPLHPENSPS
jgi:hypothetical protein